MIGVSTPNGLLRFEEKGLYGHELWKKCREHFGQQSASPIALSCDGEPRDLLSFIPDGSQVTFLMAASEQGLEILRHSCTHLMAQAVMELYPGAQLAIGPVIENGFYYDFDLEQPLSENSLSEIEAKMQEIAQRDLAVRRVELDKSEAIALFQERNASYKVEIIEGLTDQTVSCYSQGDFIDLCRGPHVPSTRVLKHFKLMKVAGAYWRGDQKNKMLQRVYGTCFATKEELQQYLHRLEEAQKRDHRVLGQRLDLFHFQEEAQGMVFWHPQGWTLFRLIEQHIRTRLAQDYQEVRTPQLLDMSLWKKSGHWDMFAQNMFKTDIEGDLCAVKPMNCPCHVQIFNQKIHSYRDLPLRLAEFGCCHRYEPSGALHGLMRLRQFTQDDAHIFCTVEQIEEEVLRFNRLLLQVYADFGFEDVRVKLSTRPQKRVGAEELWDFAENALAQALGKQGFDYAVQEGEGAFYGPKIEFQLTDSIGRSWQLGTIQLDFSMPERLGASYIDATGAKQRPVMIHRAILGSIERFIGVLIEHHAGALPLYFAPTQAYVLPISEKHRDYGSNVLNKLKKIGIRAEIDLRNEKIGYKIRDHVLKKIPLLILVGEQEVEGGTFSLRDRSGQQWSDLSLEELLEHFQGATHLRGIEENSH